MSYDKIVQYEAGELAARGTVELFAELIRLGHPFLADDHYGRVAGAFVEDRWITPGGEITQTGFSRLAGIERLN